MKMDWIVFEPRVCAERGCAATYTPTGPNARYCDDHQDARLRERGRWKDLRERHRRRAWVGDLCECCGAPAEGGSYHGVICCAQCRADADQAAKEWLEERRDSDIRRAG